MSSLPIPSSLESFLASIRSLQSAADPGAGGHVVNAGQLGMGELSEFASRSLDMLARAPLVNLSNAMDTLDGAQNSLGVAVLLTASLRQHANITDWDGIYNRVILFIAECNGEQIRYAPGCFAEMCHLFTDELIRRDRPLLGLVPLSRAITKLQPNQTTLTSVHSDLCKLSLSSKCFTLSLSLIRDVEFVDVAKETNNSAADVKYILLYFYYAGMILTAIKDFSQALYFFEVCVTMPATVVSHIMLEAYKKFLLVSLIHQGHKPKESLNLPKYTSSVVSKYFKQLSTPYNELVTAFYSNKSDELQASASKHSEVFTTDQNMGLVKQVLAAQTKTNVKRLTKTFLTLSMGELAARVGLGSPREAELLLVTMIQEGSIHARISQKDGMVRFDSNPSDHYNSIPVLRMIETNLNSCIQLDTKITSLEEEIMLNSNFIKKSNAAAASASSSGANADKGSEDDPTAGGSNSRMNGGGTSSSAAASSTKSAAASTGNGIGMF